MWLWFYAFVLDFRLFVGEIIIVTKGFGQDYPFCPVSHHWPDPVACPNVCQRTRPSTLGMSDLDSIAVLLFTNRWWIPNSLYCSRGFQIFYSGLFASTFVYKTVSSTDNKIQQSKRFEWKTFTFHQLFLSHPPGQKPAPGRTRPISGSQEKGDRFIDKKCRDQKFSHRPQHTSNPLQAPPARLFTSSPPPAGLQVGKGWGDLHK